MFVKRAALRAKRNKRALFLAVISVILTVTYFSLSKAHFENNIAETLDSNKTKYHIENSLDEISITKKRADYVKLMTKHAWDTYAAHAMGSNEFSPISVTGQMGNLFGHGHTMGAFVIDSLDTLMLMDLHDDVESAIKWIRDMFKPDLVQGYVNVFEVNIRILGGLLGAYTLSNNAHDQKILLKACTDVADRLLKAYDLNKSNLAFSLVDLQSGDKKLHDWSHGCIILSEAGTLQLEMDYLTKVSGNTKYSNIARISTESLLRRFNGNTYLPIDDKYTCRNHISMGALGDSFFEYLLKIEILSKNAVIGNNERFKAFLSSLNVVESKILKQSNPKATYFQEYSDGRYKNVMTHLACFSGGMYALASLAHVSSNLSMLEKFERLARNITWICRQSYVLGNGLGPETFIVDDNGHLSESNPSYYILRPEYAESLYYLFKLTGDNIYREWAWEMVTHIEKRCKVIGGYASIKDVFHDSTKDDYQHTFFIAETLKYLYLIFDDKINLNEYVFNTEAHPFKIL